MCISIPYKIIEITDKTAKAEAGGEIKDLKLDVIEDKLKVGDFVLVQEAYAISKISSKQANDLKKLFG
jgi:hydrogenase expression/formation protein HypC